MMKRKRERDCETPEHNEEKAEMEIVWQTPLNPPHRDDYILHSGKRYVKPYHFEFICHVKNRWAGKTIVDLFAEEFKGRPHDYYVRAVKSGRIQVDGKNVSIYYRVKPTEKITHFVHRHEPPVMAWDVTILKEEEEVLSVCKPASVPVHPCGQYRKNTVLGILEAEYGFAPLFPIHRLDRLVSGLLILARSSAKADIFRQQIEGGLLCKQYIAKVAGIFPEGEVVDVNVNYDAREGRSTAEGGDGSNNVKLKGKTACTKFKRISTNGDHSIVLCEPLTGRTHQIRVHLQYAGHPIANDMLYRGDLVSGRSTVGMSADRAAAKLRDTLSSKTSEENDDPEEGSHTGFSIDPMCTNCPNLAPEGSKEVKLIPKAQWVAHILSVLLKWFLIAFGIILFSFVLLPGHEDQEMRAFLFQEGEYDVKTSWVEFQLLLKVPCWSNCLKVQNRSLVFLGKVRQTEVVNRILGSLLRALVSKSGKDWDLKLSHAEFAYNRTPSATTRYSPFEIVYGTNPYVPIDLIALPKDKFIHESAKEQAEFMVQVHKEVRRNIEKANESYRKKHNKHVKGAQSFNVGDLVWVYLRKERFPSQRKHKLMPRAEGPYEIIEKIGENAYKLDLEGRHGVSNTFNVGDLAPYHEDAELRSIPFEEGEDDLEGQETVHPHAKELILAKSFYNPNQTNFVLHGPSYGSQGHTILSVIDLCTN